MKPSLLNRSQKKSFLLSFLIALGGWSHASFAEKPFVCEGDYALCTTAECFPIPGHPERALCHCKTKTGYSAGYRPCQETKTTEEGYKEIKSRYYPIKSYVKCTNDRPWTSCLDSPCLVDAQDPSKAVCTCSLVKGKGDYVLPSDTCDKKKCDAGLWSSALVTNNDELESQLQEAIREGKFPAAQSKMCK